jgi:hypothetical protein
MATQAIMIAAGRVIVVPAFSSMSFTTSSPFAEPRRGDIASAWDDMTFL